MSDGAAVIFVASGSGWVRQATLTAPTGANGDQFGASVAVDGNIAVVGAPVRDFQYASNAGAAYVFTRSGTTWSYAAELKALDLHAGDAFGASVAIDGTTVIIGAPQDNEKGASVGLRVRVRPYERRLAPAVQDDRNRRAGGGPVWQCREPSLAAGP